MRDEEPSEERPPDAEERWERDREAWSLPLPRPSPTGPVSEFWPVGEGEGEDASRESAA